MPNSSTKASTGQALFQCGDCKQSYTRVDHLARHVRSHTQEKPYRCLVCHKRFARTDLLKRHGSVHESTSEEPSKRQKRQESARVGQACIACAENHVRCEENKPCRRCQKKNIPCRSSELVDDENLRGTDAAAGLLQLAQDQTRSFHAQSPNRDLQQAAQRNSTVLDALENNDIANSIHDDLSSYEQHDGPLSMPPPTNGHDQHWSFEQHNSISQNLPSATGELSGVDELPGFLRGVLSAAPDPSHGLGWPGYSSGTWTPRGLMGFGFESNLELNDVDFSFLDTYNANIPFDIETPLSEDQSAAIQSNDYSSHKTVASRSEAFRRSVWRFIPKPQDSASAEQQNLSLPNTDGDHASPESRIHLDRRTTAKRLDQTCRDKVIALVLSTCKPANMFRSVSAFPSAELLDSLLQFFLTSPLSEADRWLHIPTFCTTIKSRTEILVAAISAGAVLTPDTSLRKLGYALQEAVRVYVPTQWEENNANIRDLQLMQAFMLHLEIALWSGNSRKIEIAESFQQPLFTMLRRGGKFRRYHYTPIIPNAEDSGPELAQKWNRWIEQESYIRLAFRVFQHATQCSMALLTTPIVSYAELLLPLPESRELWLAPDAESWKRAALSRRDAFESRPSLLDCMNNLEILSSSDMIDRSEASLAFLYAIWTLVWEYRQLSSVLKRPSYHWDNSLIMASRYQELIKLLQHFRVTCAQQLSSTRERLNIVLELTLMHLHLSLEDVQLFAGLEGQEEASRVFPILRSWVKTPSSRQAVWHAGQVIRSAKLLPTRFVHNFSAIAVYHAALAFWSYRLILQAEHTSEREHLLSNGPIIWLDEHDGPDVQRFIASERGSPAIHGILRPDGSESFSGNSSTTLQEPNTAMKIAIEILQANHEPDLGAKPPLVENLIQLMTELQAAAKDQVC